MTGAQYHVDPDIRRARTLPAEFYRSRATYDALLERVFARSWQWVGPGSELPPEAGAQPLVLLPGSLEQPLVLTRDEGGAVRCLSNVCTHRGNLVQARPGACRTLRCEYHGRKFGLDGSFRSMPGFDGVEEFPSPADDLPSLAMEALRGHRFVSLDPEVSFGALTREIREHVGHLPLEEFRFDPARSRDYDVEAHWALYVDNYLEGFHVPYVHPELARNLDVASYRIDVFPQATLQTGIAREGEAAFEGTDVGGYYVWLFPNTMLNFYPWGLSVNVVQPRGLARTRVAYRTYVWRPELLGQGAGGALDTVELQDEAVVEGRFVLAGDEIVLLGENTGELGGSEYL